MNTSNFGHTLRTARRNGRIDLSKRRAWFDETQPGTTPTEPPTAQPPAQADDDDFDLDKLPSSVQEYIKKLRGENADRRKSAKSEKQRADELAAELAKRDKDKETAAEAELAAQKRFEELAQKKAQEAQEWKQKYEAELQSRVRERIAIQAGLPSFMADRLKGDTEEALKADAEQLAAFIVKPKDEQPQQPQQNQQQPASNTGRPQQTTTAVPGGQPVTRTDGDRRSEYFTGVKDSPMFQKGQIVIHNKSEEF